MASGAPPASADPAVCYNAATNTKHVIYLGPFGHLYEIRWVPGSTPTFVDLTLSALAHGPPRTVPRRSSTASACRTSPTRHRQRAARDPVARQPDRAGGGQHGARACTTGAVSPLAAPPVARTQRRTASAPTTACRSTAAASLTTSTTGAGAASARACTSGAVSPSRAALPVEATPRPLRAAASTTACRTAARRPKPPERLAVVQQVPGLVPRWRCGRLDLSFRRHPRIRDRNWECELRPALHGLLRWGGEWHGQVA